MKQFFMHIAIFTIISAMGNDLSQTCFKIDIQVHHHVNELQPPLKKI